MKKAYTLIILSELLMTFAIGMISADGASAENAGNLMFSAHSNSVWVINKSTRKMIFIRFLNEDDIWKSNDVSIQADFNLDKCTLRAVGARGASAFLCDTSSGLITIYQAQKDHTILKSKVVNVQTYLK